jgi:hypothetical protein
VKLRVWARLVLWQRDADRARRLLGEIKSKSPAVALSKRWLELCADGTKTTGMPPELNNVPLSPFLRWFFLQMGAEVAAFQGQLDEALALEGHLDLGWIEACPLFEPLRARAEWSAIHDHHRERAARVIAEHESPLT